MRGLLGHRAASERSAPPNAKPNPTTPSGGDPRAFPIHGAENDSPQRPDVRSWIPTVLNRLDRRQHPNDSLAGMSALGQPIQKTELGFMQSSPCDLPAEPNADTHHEGMLKHDGDGQEVQTNASE